MSSHNDSGMDNPIAGIAPPRKSKKLWMYGGLGCLGIIGLVCVGFVALVYFAGLKPMQEFQQQTVSEAVEISAVQDILGSPVSAGPAVPAQVPGESQTFIFRAPVTGSKAEGTLVFEGKLEGMTWVRNSLILESDGEQTDLEQEVNELFDLPIDDGQ